MLLLSTRARILDAIVFFCAEGPKIESYFPLGCKWGSGERVLVNVMEKQMQTRELDKKLISRYKER